jgi:hypothetical protein
MNTTNLEEIRSNQLTKHSYVYVHKYDEEDWMELFNSDLVEEYEDGKAFLRAN